MEKEKVLSYVESTTDLILIEQYAQERSKKLIRAGDLLDFLEKASDEEVVEIIFDYSFVNKMASKEMHFDELTRAQLRGATLKIMPAFGLNKEMRKMYRAKLLKILPDIKEKLFE